MDLHPNDAPFEPGIAPLDPAVMTDARTAFLESKYGRTGPLYDILDWPWERGYRKWRPLVVGDLSGKVLEAGVGTGRNLAYYSTDADVLGIDLSEAMLARARPRASRAACPVTLRRADALDLSEIPDASFDWYLATFLYCVLPDELQPSALAEMARILVPGGRFRLVEILYSQSFRWRLPQLVLGPLVELVYGARFDRQTRRHLEDTPELEVTSTRWLRKDTHLLIEGRRV